MSNIILPNKRLLQPQSATSINWSNPLTKGLYSAVVAGNYVDLVSGNSLISVRPENLVDSLYETGIYSEVRATITGGATTLTVPASGISTRSFSFLGNISRTKGSGVGGRAGINNILLWHASGQWDMRLGGTNYTQAGVADTGVWYNLAITGSPTAARLYVDGTQTISGGAPASTSFSDFVCGTDPGGGGSWDFAYSWFGFWERTLSVEEILEINRNPWQLFEASRTSIYTIPTAPSLPSLSNLITTNITSSGARHSLTLTY